MCRVIFGTTFGRVFLIGQTQIEGVELVAVVVDFVQNDERVCWNLIV